MSNLGPMAIIIILVIISFCVPALALPAIAFWKICSRAGFNGALGLLMLIPIANIVLPLYVAFARWPVLEQEPKQGVRAD